MHAPKQASDNKDELGIHPNKEHTYLFGRALQNLPQSYTFYIGLWQNRSKSVYGEDYRGHG